MWAHAQYEHARACAPQKILLGKFPGLALQTGRAPGSPQDSRQPARRVPVGRMSPPRRHTCWASSEAVSAKKRSRQTMMFGNCRNLLSCVGHVYVLLRHVLDLFVAWNYWLEEHSLSRPNPKHCHKQQICRPCEGGNRRAETPMEPWSSRIRS